MPTPILHKVTTAFDDRNAFLQVSLGAISALRHFKKLLENYGTADTAMPVVDEGSDPTEPEVLHCLLGLISISQHAMKLLDAARTKRGIPPVDDTDALHSPSAQTPVPLRRLLE
jgi:hypothetical protein